MRLTVIDYSLIRYWNVSNTPRDTRIKFLKDEYRLYAGSYNFKSELCAFYWEDREIPNATSWNEFREKFRFRVRDIIKVEHFKKYVDNQIKNIHENQLQKQETDVVRRDDTERSGIQGRRNKTLITVGHLSNKAIRC